jgi:hypothetical protein
MFKALWYELAGGLTTIQAEKIIGSVIGNPPLTSIVLNVEFAGYEVAKFIKINLLII